MSPSDWPLSTVRLLDGDQAEVFMWTGWEYPEALHDLANVNAAYLYRLRICTAPDELYDYIIEPGRDVYDAVHDIIVSVDKTASNTITAPIS